MPLIYCLGKDVAVGNVAQPRPQGQIPLQVMPLHGSALTKWACSQGLAEVLKGPCGAAHCGNKV